MPFPDEIDIGKKKFTKVKSKDELSGLNPKQVYQGEDGGLYIAKVEKERKVEDIFKGVFKTSSNDPALLQKLKKHVADLRDGATTTSVIASNVAFYLFPNLIVPENILFRLEDGTPFVLSKFLPLSYQFSEFLSETKPVKELSPKDPKSWKELPKRKELHLTEEQSRILGQIYYVALVMGHWDILNNINLTNSGSVKMDEELKPCIVDWGNCLGIGFGGLSQDSTAFQNPDFDKSKDSKSSDPVTGFTGTAPFGSIVLPNLPRQLVSDLFHLTGEDKTSQAMLKGFKEMHENTQKVIKEMPVNTMVEKAKAKTFNDEKVSGMFKKSLDHELFGEKNTLGGIIEGRIESIDGIIKEIDKGKTMEEIFESQFKKIAQSQTIEKKETTRDKQDSADGQSTTPQKRTF